MASRNQQSLSISRLRHSFSYCRICTFSNRSLSILQKKIESQREEETLQNKKSFFTVFLIFGFLMKIAAEIVHEVLGHGLFVLLFGGKIINVYISILWPYDFSWISWDLPEGITSGQMAWVYAGGIIACLCTSFLIQAFLLWKKRFSLFFALPLFWLAFWALVNSTGYLIIGGLASFGDVQDLISLGVLTSFLSLVLGLIVFFMGFIALSWILRRISIEMFSPKKASFGVTVFWLIIPILVAIMLANPERGLRLYYLPLTFIPVLLSLIMEYFLVLSKQ